MLRAVDNRWVRHLTDLDELREGIGLRAFAQQDPLVAYKKEAHEMYQELVASIAHDIVYAIYHAQFTRPADARAPDTDQPRRRGRCDRSRPQQRQDARPQRSVLVRQRQEVQELPPASRPGARACARRRRVNQPLRSRPSNRRRNNRCAEIEPIGVCRLALYKSPISSVRHHDTRKRKAIGALVSWWRRDLVESVWVRLSGGGMRESCEMPPVRQATR